LREDRSADRPFFLLIHLFDSHQPYDPPPPIQERFLRQPYAGEVVFTDSLVGLLLDELKDQGLDKNTVVSIVGDHGEAFREHNEATHGFLLYETTLHVPWILAGPGIPSARAQGPVGLVNVAPTLLASCGLPFPTSHQGANLLDQVKGSGRAVQLQESGIYLETYLSRLTHKWSELLGWRKGEWKYVRGPRSELFNLDSDPEEQENLFESEAEKAEELSNELDEYLRRENAYRLKDVVTSPDEKTRERLESLGYVGGASDADMARPGWEVGLPDPRDAIVFWNRRQEAKAFYRIALSSFHGGNFEESLKWADNAILADSTHMDALLLRCKSLAALERYEEAVQHYGALLQRRPDDESAWIGMGIALDLLGRWEKAKTAFESALLVNVDSPEANFNLASLLARRQRFIDAAPYYERVRELEPENVPIRADLARIYLRLNQSDHALEILEEAYELDPAHPGTLLLLGSLHLEKGDSSRGREILEKFLSLHPDRPEVAEVRKALEDL
jgi:tetratricopeptide (TPR) repeat protein